MQLKQQTLRIRWIPRHYPHVTFPKGLYNLKIKGGKNPELSEIVSTTHIERVEKKLTSHSGGKLHFLHKKVCDLRLVVVLQIRNNLKSKCKVPAISRNLPEMAGEDRETLSRGRKWWASRQRKMDERCTMKRLKKRNNWNWWLTGCYSVRDLGRRQT